MSEETFQPLPGEAIAEKADALRQGEPLSRAEAVALAESALHYAAEASLAVAAEKQRISVRSAQQVFKERRRAEAAALGLTVKQLAERKYNERLKKEAAAMGVTVEELKRRKAAEKKGGQ